MGSCRSIRIADGITLDLWAFASGVTLDFSRPRKLTDNVFIESLNGKFRAECLNSASFLTLKEGRRKFEAWRLRPKSISWCLWRMQHCRPIRVQNVHLS